MKNQKFGIEIEFTGMSRCEAARVVAQYLQTHERYDGGIYDEYSIIDNQGRKWKIVSDSSIRCSGTSKT